MAEARGAGLDVRLAQAAPIPLDAALACEPGELLALVGPSGSGKSTILRVIAGLFRPREGVVRCNGDTWLDTQRGIDLPPQRRAVGLVFQHYALFPHLTALENITLALRSLPRAARDERARALLELVNLTGFEARRPAELSGGQQQRIAVARALAREPRVLLMDEPFSAVDQVTRRKLQRELVELRRTLRIPLVLVTHDLEEARMLADQMSILHRGQTLRRGPPVDVMSRPGDALVARMIGLTNLFDGVVCEQRPDAGHTLLEWRGRLLEARHDPAFASGTRVTWVVPPESVILHRRDRPSRGERENPVSGVVDEFVPLGELASVTLLLDGADALPLSFVVPTHVARRNGVVPGVNVTVSLLAEGIHLMPVEGRSGQTRA
jgi:molybdate transport system ATP-binding protein